jgi:DNA-binding response OmpR family regulator
MRYRSHILLVSSAENDPELELLAYFLRGAGLRMTWTRDIASTRTALQTSTIDCVVMDGELSGGSSNSVAAHAMRLRVPAVILSRSPHFRHYGRRQAYIRRPILFPELRDAISAALRSRDEIIMAYQRSRRLNPHASSGD